MVLANRTRVQNSRTLLRAFGGLNEGYGCSEAESSASATLSMTASAKKIKNDIRKGTEKAVF